VVAKIISKYKLPFRAIADLYAYHHANFSDGFLFYTMIVRRQKRNERFSIINNVPIEDKNLSAVSLGVYTYIMSKPDNWNAHKNEIYKRFEIANLKTSKNLIDSAFSELIKAGYIVLHTPIQRLENGQVRFLGKEYIFMDEPKKTESTSFSTSQDCGVSRNSDNREIEIVENFRESRELAYITSTDLIINTNNKLNTDFNNKKESSFVEKIEESVEDVKYYFETSQILELLTEKTKAKYKIPKSKSLLLRYGPYKLIKERLEDGSTMEECIKVIESKYNEWKGTEFMRYLIPETIFRKSNFEKYLTQSQIQIEDNLSQTQKPIIDDKGNYSDTDAGREQFILDVRELAAKTFRK
jgi:uncharacterized phage protein (TIGR02220 family)